MIIELIVIFSFNLLNIYKEEVINIEIKLL